MATKNGGQGLEALHQLGRTDAPEWLAPTTSLSSTARSASQRIFSLLKPFVPKSPFEELLIDGFDAEQIWQQIDLQSQPLLSSLGREIRGFEKNPDEIKTIFGEEKIVGGGENRGLEKESLDLDENLDDIDDDEEMEGEEGENDKKEEERESDEEVDGVEDKFLKIDELEEYLEDDEAREYGLKTSKKNKNKKGRDDDGEQAEDEDESDKEDEDEENEDDELGGLGVDDDGSEELENIRYDDFFGANKKKVVKRKSDLIDGSEDSETEDEQEDDAALENQKKDTLSTHQKEQEKLQSKIEQLEKANLEPKSWTMQGEVTAEKRPKNSALEVDLDFEHNARPAPVITEEVTASIEEIIQKRILEGHFDDVQKAPSLPTKALRELKELDENKSKKGLAEIYEEEYVQMTNTDFVPTSLSDEQKKEASSFFKKLCLKLDALSHFHFTPKPKIDDMSVQTNVPALAMEEVAPVAVSDAAMLAPEEVFSGKGDIKEDTELTQAERKRRRANKKRKFKTETEKRMAKKGFNPNVTAKADKKKA